MTIIKEIEDCITYNMLETFLCQNETDFDLFARIDKDELKLNVNVLVLGAFDETTDLKKMVEIGFDGNIRDFFETKDEFI